MNAEYAHKYKLQQDEKKLQYAVIYGAGSLKTQGSEEYSRIVESVARNEEAITGLARQTVMNSFSGRGSDGKRSATGWFTTEDYWVGEGNDNALYTNGNNKTNTNLRNRMNAIGLTSSGKEVADMRKYLEAISGVTYTDQEIKDMGSDADSILAQQIYQAELAKETSALIDKVYELQESDA
jgi:hypothetical protein